MRSPIFDPVTDEVLLPLRSADGETRNVPRDACEQHCDSGLHLPTYLDWSHSWGVCGHWLAVYFWMP